MFKDLLFKYLFTNIEIKKLKKTFFQVGYLIFFIEIIDFDLIDEKKYFI